MKIQVVEAQKKDVYIRYTARIHQYTPMYTQLALAQNWATTQFYLVVLITPGPIRFKKVG